MKYYLRPIDVRRGGKKICQTTARYAIRSGAKQFAAYLNGILYTCFISYVIMHLLRLLTLKMVEI